MQPHNLFSLEIVKVMTTEAEKDRQFVKSLVTDTPLPTPDLDRCPNCGYLWTDINQDWGGNCPDLGGTRKCKNLT